MTNQITFSVTHFFDPYGDGKSARKVLKREFFHTCKTPDEIRANFPDNGKYYGEKLLKFKPYRRTKNFDL